MQARARDPLQPNSISQTNRALYGPSADGHDNARTLVPPNAWQRGLA